MSSSNADIKLSKRLFAVAELVAHPTVADVGCDHGLLSAYLIKKGIAKKAIATDKNTGPLSRALKTADRMGLAQALDVRLGDGLCALRRGEAETCVIAGMGGQNIIGILKGSEDVTRDFSQLVLQPERDAPAVRRFLHAAGFYIRDEIILWEKPRFYIIIDARKGAEAPYDELGYAFGRLPLLRRDETLRVYLRRELAKTAVAAEGETRLTAIGLLCREALKNCFNEGD